MSFRIAPTQDHAMRKYVREKFHAGKNQKLVAMMTAEFDPRPGGLVLPHNQVVKRFDSKRIERVLWKIVRGLHFHRDDNEVLPENWQLSWSFTTRQEPGPPEHSKLFRDLPNVESLALAEQTEDKDAIFDWPDQAAGEVFQQAVKMFFTKNKSSN